MDADLIERSDIRTEKQSAYDTVIYGGGLFASGIHDIDFVTKNPYNQLIVFTVGLSDPITTDYSAIIDKNIPVQLRNKVKVFYLRSGIEYSKLGFVHRGMIAIKQILWIYNLLIKSWIISAH